MRASVALAIALGLALLAMTAAAEDVSVYRWVDNDGVQHFTDRPPSGAPAELTGIRSQRTDPGAVQARVDQTSETIAEAQKRRSDEADERDEAAKERAETRQQRADNCEKARERLETYSTARRLYRPMPDGERDYLSSEEMDAARSGAQQEVDDWCD